MATGKSPREVPLAFVTESREVTGNVREVSILTESNFSLITRVSCERGTLILKALGARELETLSGDARHARAQELVQLISQFHAVLERSGVRLPSPYAMFVTSGGWAVQAMPDMGPDYAKRMHSTPDDLPLYVRGILQTTRGPLHQQQPYCIGIDFRLSNFGGSAPAATCYFDTIPPLFSPDGGATYHVHMPNPTDPRIIKEYIGRKFDPRGMLRFFRFELLSITPDLEELLLRELQTVLEPERYAEVTGYLDSCSYRWVTPATPLRDILALIERIGASGFDTMHLEDIREIAARWIPVDAFRAERMQRVFYALRSPAPNDPRSASSIDERIARLVAILNEL